MNTNISDLNSLSSNSLLTLGWDPNLIPPSIQRTDQDPTASNFRLVRVLSVLKNKFLVSDGLSEWQCVLAGKQRHAAQFNSESYPLTGDWAYVDQAGAMIMEILPRKNLFSRGEAGLNKKVSSKATEVRQQAIAANIDTVLVVCGLDRDFNIRRLERYLTLVLNCGIDPVLVLTKADLHSEVYVEACLAEAESIAVGTPVIVSSNVDGRGGSEIGALLSKGKTVAMMGSSGAGKTTLLNSLYGSDIRGTGAMNRVGKGSHTTTTRELIRMPQGGVLNDNPGIREITFSDTDDDRGLKKTFRDIGDYAPFCRFANCTHTNEPGCAVIEAIDKGELPSERLGSFQKLKSEMDYVNSRRDKSANRVEKERWKGVSKRIKQMQKHPKHR